MLVSISSGGLHCSSALPSACSERNFCPAIKKWWGNVGCFVHVYEGDFSARDGWQVENRCQCPTSHQFVR
jgi:hypothetical protein